VDCDGGWYSRWNQRGYQVLSSHKIVLQTPLSELTIIAQYSRPFMISVVQLAGISFIVAAGAVHISEVRMLRDP
jgi:hypothetical protein